MRLQKLTAIAALLAMLPIHVGAAGSISVEDTVAGVPVTIGVQGLPQGAYDIVVQRAGGSASSDVIVPVAVDASGSADALLRASEVEMAGDYVITLEQNGDVLGPSGRFTVAPGPFDADMSEVVTLGDTLIADGEDLLSITLRATDGFSNPLVGRPLAVLSSRPDDVIVPDSDETDDFGEQSFTLSTTEEGTIYLRGMDLITGQMFSAGVTVEASTWGIGNSDRVASVTHGGKTFYYAAQAGGGGGEVIDHFTITAPKRVRAGSPVPRVTIKAQDAKNKTVVSYEGTVICSSTDPQADLPEDIVFDGSNRGVRNLDVNFVLNTQGAQDIKCEDSGNPDIFGVASVEVQGGSTGGGGGGGLVITDPKPDQWINSLEVHVTGETSEFKNITIMGGLEDLTVESDDLGKFTTNDPENPVPLVLEPGQTDYTINVQVEGGPSKLVTIHFDDEEPELTSVTFAPEKPRTNENVLAVVETETEAAVRLHFVRPVPAIEDIVLDEESDGTYQKMFKAPLSGNHQIEVIAVDKAGNEIKQRVVLAVEGEGLPAVENLTGKAIAGGKAELAWDPVEGATGYMIYVGSKADVWEETLETNKGGRGAALTEAEVAGIPAGAVRYFAVTALKHDQRGDFVESLEKSNVLEVRMLGMILEATPQDSSVALKWSGLPKDLQVDSYLLQYGPSPDDYQEMRTIAGKAQSQQVRDLINGITYYFQLTPITVAGVKVDELAARDDASPVGGPGFRPAPAEPIPYNVATKAPATPAHAGAPLENTGLPSFVWVALIGFGIAGTLYWHRRRNLHRTMALLEQMARQYHV